MIQLDPTEIFGSAIWDAFKRGFSFFGCLLLGSALALLGALGAETLLGFTPLSGSYFLPPIDAHLLLSVPFFVMTSIAGLIAIPNAFAAVFYYIRSEEPAAKQFLIFAAIQQFSLTIAFNEWAFESNFLLDSLLSSALLWLFFLALLAFLFFSKVFLKNKIRCNHEEHLMTVAAENAVWRHKLENTEFIPPPPSGPQSPKARPLK